MSALVFPIMPVIWPAKAEAPIYATKVMRAPSGKSVRAASRASPIVNIRFSLWLCAARQCASPWAAYTEPGLVRYFFDTHKGRWDSWLLDNSTGAYATAGASQPRVVFTTDRLPMREEMPGIYIADFELETVL